MKGDAEGLGARAEHHPQEGPQVHRPVSLETRFARPAFWVPIFVPFNISEMVIF